MRLLTEMELSYWNAGLFPCCGATTHLRGPRGGIMRNVRCPQCDTVLNVIDPDSGAATPQGMGQMIYEPAGYLQPTRFIKDPLIKPVIEAEPTFLQSLKTWISALIYSLYSKVKRDPVNSGH